jgi:hypothetical protein
MTPIPNLVVCALSALALLAGCDRPSSEAPAGETSNSLAVLPPPMAGYFTMTHLDQRKCASPRCGGYFVKLVNERNTRCADGTPSSECHALRLDFGPSGIDPAEAARFESAAFATGHALVQGRLVRRALGVGPGEDVLEVTEAWEGAAGSVPRGGFERLNATGKLCVTYPCDSFSGERLNVGTVTSYNAVDLAASGAPPEAVARGQAALQSKGGLLAAGVPVPIVGPAGEGQDFRASEFYLRIPLACGSRGLPACGSGQFCDFPDGSACGAADRPGLCEPRPQLCPDVFQPVCGCDGKTYGNGCQANAAGTDVASQGPCACQPQDCGPPPPVAICPNGTPPPVSCEPDASAACHWKVGPCPVCVQNVLCIVGDHFDPVLCKCAPDAPQCSTAADCKGLLPRFCVTCADGTFGCAHWACVQGACQIATCP